MKTIAKIILSILALIIIVSFISKAMDKSEIYDCITLEKQSETYSNFFITGWQDQMCKSHNIIINAEVK